MLRCVIALLLVVAAGFAQVDGGAAYAAFLSWRKAPENGALPWAVATERYRAKLVADGVPPAEAGKILSVIASRDEGVFYDSIYGDTGAGFLRTANPLLMEAVKGRKPGRALDVGMGQGRNAVYLAKLGWDVTGFDTSAAGLAQARMAGVKLNAVLASDEEFDFGVGQWDLIALIYPLEKRSVYRIREALRPGGLVVVECAHKEAGGAPFEYDTNELLRIFEGFVIRKYEDVVAEHEWARKPLRLVRLVAEKARAGE